MDYRFDTTSVIRNENDPEYQIEIEFENKKNIKSDINEHLDTLAKYASECGHITEMGVRSVVSTWAFLISKPKRLVSIDINPAPIEKALELAKSIGVDMDFIIADTVDPNFEIEETDLLFIDIEFSVHHPDLYGDSGNASSSSMNPTPSLSSETSWIWFTVKRCSAIAFNLCRSNKVII